MNRVTFVHKNPVQQTRQMPVLPREPMKEKGNAVGAAVHPAFRSLFSHVHMLFARKSFQERLQTACIMWGPDSHTEAGLPGF